MIAAATLGIFLIPMLYVIFQRLRERVSGAGAKERRVVVTGETPQHRAAE
jgi:hypothetical protein